jgi:tRNA1Val (adenine37-N6)-methyltransferase
MSNNYFQFKQFTIHQQQSAMKVGTDGVLLGAWAHYKKVSRILDIGTGTGLIALMLAQRCSAEIDAIELDEAAYYEAVQNAKNSPWPSQINVWKQSFQEFANHCQNSYDLLVCNPPFFKHSLKASSEQRTIARHSDSLNASELFPGIQKLLALSGKFDVIIPTDNLPEYCIEAEKNSLHLNQLLWVKPTPEKSAKRVLCSFSKTKLPLKEKTLVVESGGRHVYSEEYKKLTCNFYLRF